MHGFFGKILQIDLSAKSSREKEISPNVYRTYLGGRGLGAYLLLNEQPHGVDALSPESNLVFAVGPATDTQVWGSSRYGVFSRSPATGLFGESYSGGRVAEHMSRCGYDAFMISGKADKPVYLEITSAGVVFHDAAHVWGKDTYAAQDALTQATGKPCGVLVIGPAGENQARMAVIENNYWRSAGRSGMGTIMGAKNLKGLVFHGDAQRPVAAPLILKELWDNWKVKASEHPAVNAFKNNGTPLLVAVINKVSAFPTRYWSSGQMAGWEDISAERLHQDLKVTPHACAKCFIACGRMSEVQKGRHKGLKIEGPEYETIYAFGGLCGITSIEEIAWLNDICDRLGLDTISAGNLAAFAIEASLQGKIQTKIDYGDVDGVAMLLRQMAFREGDGAVLADGIRHAAKAWDMESFAIDVKGLEPAGYDPRIFKTMALSYATSPRGGCHLRTTAFRAELVGDIPMEQVEGKAAVVIDFEDRATLHDALITCRFYRDLYAWEGLGTIIHGTTGTNLDTPGLTRLAANIRNIVQRFNISCGWNKSMDTLPPRFFKEAVGDNRTVKKEELDQLIADYYRLRGWSALGVPEDEEKPVLN